MIPHAAGASPECSLQVRWNPYSLLFFRIAGQSSEAPFFSRLRVPTSGQRSACDWHNIDFFRSLHFALAPLPAWMAASTRHRRQRRQRQQDQWRPVTTPSPVMARPPTFSSMPRQRHPHRRRSASGRREARRCRRHGSGRIGPIMDYSDLTFPNGMVPIVD